MRKFGVYSDDRTVFDFYRDGRPNAQQCLEAQIMDLADDISYSVHDVEDAIVAGHLRLEEFTGDDAMTKLIDITRAWYLPDARDEDIVRALDRLRAAAYWPRDEYTGSRRDQASLKHMTSQLIGRFAAAAEAATREEFGWGPLGRYAGSLVVPDASVQEIAVLKGLATVTVMVAEDRLRLQEIQADVLRTVAEYFGRASGRHGPPLHGGSPRCGHGRAATARRRRSAGIPHRSLGVDALPPAARGQGGPALMAGLIKREDIDEVRSRTRLDDVVGEFVSLRTAGVGSLKGLCPFHDERTPSFHVRPQVGMYHCFGCGESGDVFTFLQKLDGVTFAEAVERQAERVGVQLRYEEGEGPPREEVGRRQRLIEMHQVAEEYFRRQLGESEAQIAREYLAARGFDAEALDQFGVGYAPRGWDNLLRFVRGRGFTTEEITASGLVSEGRRGIYDRFRGRIMWPIRDVTGRTIGFGARKLYEDDQGPKYLNTPETPLYRKAHVLYGLDLAKREIARTKRVVVVEGYTDVMAAHLAGVGQAVATCGTAFGEDHAKVVSRLLGDEAAGSGEVVFTFDGDEAGQRAALKAFELEQRFVAQTFVAVEAGGPDPSDLRAAEGDAAVRDLVDGRRPLFEFAITQAISRFDLSTVEGRVGAMRAAAPVVASIRDAAMRPGYERLVAGRLGVGMDEVAEAVRRAKPASGGRGRTGERRADSQPSSRGAQQSGRGTGQSGTRQSGAQQSGPSSPERSIPAGAAGSVRLRPLPRAAGSRTARMSPAPPDGSRSTPNSWAVKPRRSLTSIRWRSGSNGERCRWRCSSRSS